MTARFQFFKFIYLTRNLFVIKIFLETLLGSPAQVNCVPDKILFDKSLRLIFSSDFFRIRRFCRKFTYEKDTSVSATVVTLVVNFNSSKIKFVSRVCKRRV